MYFFISSAILPSSWPWIGERHSLSVQDSIHDVLEECFQTAERELKAGVGGNCEAKDEDPGDDRGNGDGALAANVLDVDGVVRDERSRDADYGCDGVVTIYYTRRGLLVSSGIGEILRQEGIKEGIAHPDGGPAEPDKAC